MSNPILPKERSVISNNNCDNTEFKEQKNSLDDCMSFEMCNEFYKIKSLQKNIVSKNESLPKYIQDILKEVYVDELFVSTCQHMVDLYSKYFFLNNYHKSFSMCFEPSSTQTSKTTALFSTHSFSVMLFITM